MISMNGCHFLIPVSARRNEASWRFPQRRRASSDDRRGAQGKGKTVMVCRLLKSVESGWLPEDDANSDEQSFEDDKQLSVDGIVYLREGESLSKGKSHGGYRGVSVPYLYADLSGCRPTLPKTSIRFTGIHTPASRPRCTLCCTHSRADATW